MNPRFSYWFSSAAMLLLLVGCGESEGIPETHSSRPPSADAAGEPASDESNDLYQLDGASKPLATSASTPASSPAPMRELQPAAPAAAAPAGNTDDLIDIDLATPGKARDEAEFNTEAYDHIVENEFLAARQNPLSTFSIDVDSASYSNVRRFLNRQQLPPPGAVRIEELVNYFTYDYPQPENDVPFSVNVEVAGCPWQTKHRLVRIGLKGREIELDQRPLTSLVFLLDVSGSMNQPNKLPLVKSAMKLLVEQLGENDSVAIAVYAGNSGMVLPPTPGNRREEIMSALDRLSAGGSTNGGEGIELAYSLAQDSYIEGGVNRVILCTDGDFNVGTTNHSELVRLIEQKAKSGVFLSVLGFGMGNYKDTTLEKLADKGNGNYGYIDTQNEARRLLVEQLNGTLVTIAKDVKIQVDFNPARVAAYRLIGYENRMLKAEDFRDDTKDAGEIGAGHTVTALYEVIPAGQPVPGADVEPSKYTTPPKAEEPGQPAEDEDARDELLTVRLRYKHPEADSSLALRVPAVDEKQEFDEASSDFRFAAAVAQFGMLLRDSKHRGESNFDAVVEIAGSALGPDHSGYRTEFLQLAGTARKLKGEGR